MFSVLITGTSVVPFKFHSKGRLRIPRQKHRVTNWRDYDAALRSRGSLTIWFTEEALAGWKAQPRKTPGGQVVCSNLAIETALTLRAVFRLALRQSEGLIGSIMRMLEIDLPIPDHPTLSRRACGLPVQAQRRTGTGDLHLIVDSTGLKLRGAGEWLFEKHGTAKRRSWRKLHIGIDADGGEIVAFDLTDKDVDDASNVETLLGQWFCRKLGVRSQRANGQQDLRSQDFELLGDRRTRVEGIPGLMFAHHADHLDASKNGARAGYRLEAEHWSDSTLD